MRTPCVKTEVIRDIAESDSVIAELKSFSKL